MIEGLESRRPKYNSLVNSSHNHTQGENPEVQCVLKRFTSLQVTWDKVVDRIKELGDQSKPWVNLTDGADELCVCLGRLEQKVSEGEDDVEHMGEEEGGDLSDKIVEFKVQTVCVHVCIGVCTCV